MNDNARKRLARELREIHAEIVAAGPDRIVADVLRECVERVAARRLARQAIERAQARRRRSGP